MVAARSGRFRVPKGSVFVILQNRALQGRLHVNLIWVRFERTCPKAALTVESKVNPDHQKMIRSEATKRSDALCEGRKRKLAESVVGDRKQPRIMSFFQPHPPAAPLDVVRVGIQQAATAGASSIDIDASGVHLHVEYPPAQPSASAVVGAAVVVPETPIEPVVEPEPPVATAAPQEPPPVPPSELMIRNGYRHCPRR